jgi:hypothetical protein
MSAAASGDHASSSSFIVGPISRLRRSFVFEGLGEEDHGGNAAISHGKLLGPNAVRFVVPQ